MQSEDSKQEASGTMTTRHALSLFRRDDQWLRNKLNIGATCSCGSCSLCAYRHIESLGTSEEVVDIPLSEKPVGSIEAPVNGKYIAACVLCKKQVPVLLYPHRLGGLIVGWVFVCLQDEQLIQGADVNIIGQFKPDSDDIDVDGK